MELDSQSNAGDQTLSKKGAALACVEKLDVHQQLADVLAEFARIKAIIAALPADLKRVVESAVRPLVLEPSREVGIRELLPSMPPGKRSKSSVYRLKKAGKIPFRKVWNRLAFDPVAVKIQIDNSHQAAAIDAYLGAHKKPRRDRKPKGSGAAGIDVA